MLLLGRKTAAEKVASFLLMMAEGQGDEHADELDVPMTRNDIADYLGSHDRNGMPRSFQTEARQAHRVRIQVAHPDLRSRPPGRIGFGRNRYRSLTRAAGANSFEDRPWNSLASTQYNSRHQTGGGNDTGGCDAGSPQRRDPASAQTRAPGRGEHVIAALCRDILERSGFRIETAGSGIAR
jgi:hypothetical protein